MKLKLCFKMSVILNRTRQLSRLLSSNFQRFTPHSRFASNEANVLVEELQTITVITLNRPEKRNCVNPDTARELVAAVKAFEENPESPVAILTGKGGNFCSGFDLEYLSSQQGNNDEGSQSVSFDPLFFNPDSPEGNGPMGPSRRFFKKPIIAAVSGYAVAGGLELALMCDLRVIDETAVIGVFCRRFGVPLIDGGTVRLPHLIGLSRAMDLILTGRAITGKEAFDIGLSNRITSCGTSLGKAMQLANCLAKFPQECMNRDRMSAYNAVYNAHSFDAAVSYEMRRGLDVIQSESVEGATKFVKGIGRHGSFHLRESEEELSKSPT